MGLLDRLTQAKPKPPKDISLLEWEVSDGSGIAVGCHSQGGEVFASLFRHPEGWEVIMGLNPPGACQCVCPGCNWPFGESGHLEDEPCSDDGKTLQQRLKEGTPHPCPVHGPVPVITGTPVVSRWSTLELAQAHAQAKFEEHLTGRMRLILEGAEQWSL